MYNYKKLNPAQLYALAAGTGPQVVVVDNFLGSEHAALVREAAIKMDEQGLLRDAKMGREKTQWTSVKARGDRLLWLTSLDPSDVPDPIRQCVRSLQSVKRDLAAESPHLGLGKRISVQLACYPGNGAGYVRHTDAFREDKPNETKRKITALYYMNPDWEVAHGGQLRAFYRGKGNEGEEKEKEKEEEEERHWDIEPIADRLLLFRSDIVPHEVLSSYATRYALTCWMYTSDQKPTAVVNVPAVIKSASMETKKTRTKTTTTTTTTATMTTMKDVDTATASVTTVGLNTSAKGSRAPRYPVTLGLHMLGQHPMHAWGTPHEHSTLSTLDYDAMPLPIESEESRATSSSSSSSSSSLCRPPPRIFVSIASYRDSECQHTVKSLYASAAYPDRIRVGICFQYDSTLDETCFSSSMSHPHRVKVMHVPATDAQGPCWARHLAESLIDGEEYVLQLDSHMRMRPNWDVYLVRSLAMCPSEKAVLTSYPLGYELPNKVPKNDVDVTMLCADYFDDDGMLRIKGKRLSGGEAGEAGEAGGSSSSTLLPPRPSLFWASGFSFSTRQFVTEVPYDYDLPHLFFGEEISMALRMFTHGWDMYTPSNAVVYHLWDRSYRPTVREHFSHAKQREKLRAQQKVRALLGMEDDKDVVVVEGEEKGKKGEKGRYGLGTSRTLEEFEKYCGVSFKNRIVHAKGARGGQPEGAYPDDNTSSAAQVMKLLQMKGLLSGF